MTGGEQFTQHLLISVDAMGYGRHTDHGQAKLQRRMLTALGEAAECAGLDRSAWERQVSGDGELAVLPDDQLAPRVVDDYVRHLKAGLLWFNRDVRNDQRLRLRLAIHRGTALRGAESYDGGGVVKVSRLCDSAPLRAALQETGADLAVIVSDRVFHDVIDGGYTSLSPSEFRKVRVCVKELVTDAFLHVPGHNVHALDLTSARRQTSHPAPNSPIVQNNFYGSVNAPDATFGPPSDAPASRQRLPARRPALAIVAGVVLAVVGVFAVITLFSATGDQDASAAQGSRAHPSGRTEPVRVFNIEENCASHKERLPGCSLGLAINPQLNFGANNAVSHRVWHDDVLNSDCILYDGDEVKDETGATSTRWFRVRLNDAPGGYAWLPGIRTRDSPPLPTCSP